MSGMSIVGDLFGSVSILLFWFTNLLKGKMFLPQVIKSARYNYCDIVLK